MRWTAVVKRGTQADPGDPWPHVTTEHHVRVRVFAGEAWRRCVVKSTQRLLKGRLTSDDANSTSHTLAWLCTSAAPCLEGWMEEDDVRGVFRSLARRKTHELVRRGRRRGRGERYESSYT
jgi:hypothetical protein